MGAYACAVRWRGGAYVTSRRRTALRARSAAAALLTLTVAAALPVRAPAAGGDSGAASAYVRADNRLMQGAVARIPIAKGALQTLLASVRRECPGAAQGSPQDPLSTQLSNEVIGAMVLTVVDHGLPLAKTFVGETQNLHWSSGHLNGEIHTYVANVRVLANLARPPLCADVRAWASSGYQTLTAGTQAFDAKFMPAWVGAGDLPGGLARYEQGETRQLAHRAEGLEERFEDFEAGAVETWGQIMNALGLWP
jgi:hypothetical protein